MLDHEECQNEWMNDWNFGRNDIYIESEINSCVYNYRDATKIL